MYYYCASCFSHVLDLIFQRKFRMMIALPSLFNILNKNFQKCFADAKSGIWCPKMKDNQCKTRHTSWVPSIDASTISVDDHTHPANTVNSNVARKRSLVYLLELSITRESACPNNTVCSYPRYDYPAVSAWHDHIRSFDCCVTESRVTWLSTRNERATRARGTAQRDCAGVLRGESVRRGATQQEACETSRVTARSNVDACDVERSRIAQLCVVRERAHGSPNTMISQRACRMSTSKLVVICCRERTNMSLRIQKEQVHRAQSTSSIVHMCLYTCFALSAFRF